MAQNMEFMDFMQQKMVDSGRIEGLEDADGLGYQISDELLLVESDEEVDGLVEYFEEESSSSLVELALALVYLWNWP